MNSSSKESLSGLLLGRLWGAERGLLQCIECLRRQPSKSLAATFVKEAEVRRSDKEGKTNEVTSHTDLAVS